MVSPRKYRWTLSLERNLSLIIITLAIVAVDRITKFYVEEYLDLGERVPVLGNFFVITRVNNSGAAFGLLQGFNIVFVLAALIVMGLLIYFYRDIIQDTLLTIASSLVLGGTIGNMLDRLYFGYVVDYLDFAYWPTFNISDMFLTVGVALLAFYLWKTSHVEKKESYYKHY